MKKILEFIISTFQKTLKTYFTTNNTFRSVLKYLRAEWFAIANNTWEFWEKAIHSNLQSLKVLTRLKWACSYFSFSLSAAHLIYFSVPLWFTISPSIHYYKVFFLVSFCLSATIALCICPFHLLVNLDYWQNILLMTKSMILFFLCSLFLFCIQSHNLLSCFQIPYDPFPY